MRHQTGKGRLDVEALEQVGLALLLAIGEDPDRPGLVDTPKRFARHWKDFIEFDAGNTDTCFELADSDEMVVVSGMRVYSFCEHHLLPFWCDVSIGYIPNKRVLGLSKFARIAHKCAHQLQIQERLVKMIASEIQRTAGSDDVAVFAQGEHSCMATRGIRTKGLMTSSVVQGKFKDDAQTRSEFLTIIGLRKL